MKVFNGSCHCGDIQIQIQLQDEPAQIHPRKCDCKFCLKHGAAYVSDPQGLVSYLLKNEASLKRYKQAPDDSAEFLICHNCGVLAGVLYQESTDQIFSAVNSLVMEDCSFARSTTVSPRLLERSDKIARWKLYWFRQVVLKMRAQ